MTSVVCAAGAVLVLAGAALVLRSATLLSGRGRPRRGPQPAFVIAGPYRRVRNPLFGGVVLVLAGAAVAARSLMLAGVAASAAAVLHAWVVRVEEPQLADRFGAAYAAYRRRVPRWLPTSPPRDDLDEER